MPRPRVEFVAVEVHIPFAAYGWHGTVTTGRTIALIRLALVCRIVFTRARVPSAIAL